MHRRSEFGTIEFHDLTVARRAIPVKLRYPAADAYRGRDMDDASRDRFNIARGFPIAAQHAVRDADAARSAFPLVMYFHGGYGHRRESTRLATHLASHGYSVAAADFPGDNIADLLPEATARRRPSQKRPLTSPPGGARQASLFIDQHRRSSAGFRIDTERIGTAGLDGRLHLMAVNSIDSRPSATFAMCPMYGENSLIPQVGRLQKLLRVDNWRRLVPRCVLSGELHPLVNANDMRQLYVRLSAPKRLVEIGGLVICTGPTGRSSYTRNTAATT